MAVLAVASLAGTVTACGGSGGDDDASDDVASLDEASDEATDATTAGTAGPEDMADAVVAFAECMREHGIDMPDPQINGDGGIAIAIEGTPGNEAEMEAAQEACEPIMENARGDMEVDPEQEAEMQAQLLEFAECMREHGIDMPDPQFQGDGRVLNRMDEDVDPESDEFQAASEACGQDGMFMASAGPGGRRGGDG
jgi:hypothetical protein